MWISQNIVKKPKKTKNKDFSAISATHPNAPEFRQIDSKPLFFVFLLFLKGFGKSKLGVFFGVFSAFVLSKAAIIGEAI